MSMFAFLRGEVLDYAQENISVSLEQLTMPPSGDGVWRINDVGNFSCAVANSGSMLLTNLKIHIYTNNFGRVRQFSKYSRLNWVNDLALEPFSLEPYEVTSLQMLQFKAVVKTDGLKDVIFAYIEGVDLSWHYPTNKSDQSILVTREKLALQIQSL